MAIKRNSCRKSERVAMLKQHQKGLSIPQIANYVSVKEHVVEQVISGAWAEIEAAGKVQQKENDSVRSTDKANAKNNEAATIAAATVMALRAAEAEQPTQELTPQQRGAITRKANAAAAADDMDKEPIPNYG